MNRPNVLIIEWDEMRADCLGYRGNTIIKTPNLDRLAAVSHDFSDHHTVSPVCAPSRHAFFSGKYPHCTNSIAGNLPLHIGHHESYWPRVMEKNGYLAGVIGKLHHTPWDEPYGFSWAKITDSPDKPGSAHGEWLKEQGIDYKELCQLKDPAMVERQQRRLGTNWGVDPVPEELSESAYITRETVAFLETSHDRPFMLHASFKKPHDPAFVPEPWSSMYADVDIPVPEIPEGDVEKRPGCFNWQRDTCGFSKITPEDWRSYLRHYYGLVSYLDHQVGLILDAVEEQGLLDNTIIVFTSDHGTMIGEHGMYGKFYNYEESTHVPLLIHTPGQTNTRQVEITNINIDVMPTVLAMCDVECPGDVQGRDMAAIMAGDDAKWDDRLYMEITGVLSNNRNKNPRLDRVKDLSRGPDEGYIHQYRRGLRTKDWKVTYHRYVMDGEWVMEWELYDRHADPREVNNLAADPEYALTLSGLKDELIEVMLKYEGAHDFSLYGIGGFQ
jgi:arylsulfatase